MSTKNPVSPVPSVPPVPLYWSDIVTVKQAAHLCAVSGDTIIRWCRRYGIGRQLSKNDPWRISRPAALMVLACDLEALEALRGGDRSSAVVAGYFNA